MEREKLHFTEDQFLPISALQHWLFCPRQCGLIHLEQAWAENKFTAEGQMLHRKAHDGAAETKAGVRITRSLSVCSYELGISGQCDIVEFHTNGEVIPVEYKRGKPKTHQADEVQLCAQAMCLEEMLKLPVSIGFLYYGEKRRRTMVEFDVTLRNLVTKNSMSLHAMIDSRITPEAVYEARRCDSCSLIELCQPKAMRFKRGAQAWFSSSIKHGIE